MNQSYRITDVMLRYIEDKEATIVGASKGWRIKTVSLDSYPKTI